MVRHRWKFSGNSNKADIYVDVNQKKTKIVTDKYIYIHTGIYPFHDYDSRRRYKR